MKPERGSEQHAEPVWKHERGEKGEKRKRIVGTRRRVLAWSGEEQALGRHERSWEGRKCGGENRYDYQGNSQKPPLTTLLGRKKVCSRQRGKRAGKKGSGRKERGRRRRV